MILSRRQTHLFSFVVLAVVLPLLFLSGIFLRPSYDAVGDSADVLFQQAGFVSASPASQRTEIATAELASDDILFQAQTFVEAEGDLVLELQPTMTLQFPDLLVYWQQGSDPPTEVSDRSLLLGTLAGSARRRFTLPTALQRQAGHLLIYSQGQQTLVAALPFAANLTQANP